MMPWLLYCTFNSLHDHDPDYNGKHKEGKQTKPIICIISTKV